MPPLPPAVNRPQQTLRMAVLRLQHETADETTQLIDDELLDLLARASA